MTIGIEVTGVTQEAAWRSRALPPVEMVRDGLWSIPVPVPTGTVRYTNVYALTSSDGTTLVDAGWDDDIAWDALSAGLEHAGTSMGDVSRVVVTHGHRDHLGQVARIKREVGSDVAMHAFESRAMVRDSGRDSIRDETYAWLVLNGVSVDQADELIPPNLSGSPFEVVEPDVLLEDGELVDLSGRRLRALWTPGHSPGHLMMLDETEGILFSGDSLLPRITTNVSARPGQSINPLNDYLVTLDDVDKLKVDEVLPAHEYRFRGHRARTEQLREHHRARLVEIQRIIEEQPGRSCWATSADLTWARPWDSTPLLIRRLALGETLAHLVLLEGRGLVTSHMDGAVRVWEPAPASRRD